MSALTTSSKLGRISLRFDLASHQTLSSYVSALAAVNGFRSSARFCRAMGIDGPRLTQGSPAALADLATISDMPVAALRRAGTWRDGAEVDHAGQRFARSDLRSATFVCPACLDEDAQAHPNRWKTSYARGRPQWRHSLVDACCVHNLRLVPLPAVEDAGMWSDDLAAQLHLAMTQGVPPRRIRRKPDVVDTFIAGRYTGQSGRVLDALCLGDALFLASFLGLDHVEAKRLAPPTEPTKRRACINKGLTIALRGEEAIVARLREIASTVNPHGACEIGPRRVFGALFDRAHRLGPDRMRPVRQMLVDICAELHIVEFSETEMLGLPLPTRTRQSLESARRRFGISDRVLRSALVEMDLLADDELRPPNQVLVDFSEVAPILDGFRESLNLADAAKRLGVMPAQLVRLCDNGVVEPFFTRPSRDLKPLRYFRKDDIESLLSDFASRARNTPPTAELVDIWDAGLKCCRPPSDIIEAIRSGTISNIWSVGKLTDLRDVRLDPTEVQISMRAKASNDVLSAEECSSVLKINLTAMRKILRGTLLNRSVSINPVNSRQQMGAWRSDVAEFHRRYASISALSYEWSVSQSRMAHALKRLRVRPAFSTFDTSVAIYTRSDVEARQAQLVTRLKGGPMRAD